jgi:hypothetical protein
MALLAEIENDKATADAAREFGRTARGALNHKGRVDRRLIGRVPLIEFDFQDGTCVVTSTCILCTTHQFFGPKIELYDLKAVELYKVSSHSIWIRAKKDDEVLRKLWNVHGNLDDVLTFVGTLQGLQSLFCPQLN